MGQAVHALVGFDPRRLGEPLAERAGDVDRADVGRRRRLGLRLGAASDLADQSAHPAVDTEQEHRLMVVARGPDDRHGLDDRNHPLHARCRGGGGEGLKVDASARSGADHPEFGRAGHLLVEAIERIGGAGVDHDHREGERTPGGHGHDGDQHSQANPSQPPQVEQPDGASHCGCSFMVSLVSLVDQLAVPQRDRRGRPLPRPRSRG